jgi:hypothetical protein
MNSRKQARDTKGMFLYRLTIERQEGCYTVEFLKRKTPIKRFSLVLNNEIKKRGLAFTCYKDDGIQSASLAIYELWDYERNNPK